MSRKSQIIRECEAVRQRINYLRELYGFNCRVSTQPGCSGELYLKAIKKIKDVILEYGFEKLSSLDAGTPIMRIFNKLAYALGSKLVKT